MEKTGLNKDIYELAERVKNSDRDAYSKLFNILWEPLYSFAQSILMDESKSKDILQDVWIDYWVRREEIDYSNIKAYLYQAVRNQVYKNFRKMPFESIHQDTLKVIEEIPTIIQEHDKEFLISNIKNSFYKLPKRFREILFLSRMKGLSNDEIAQQLGISKRTVENQLSLALKELKKNLNNFLSLLFF